MWFINIFSHFIQRYNAEILFGPDSAFLHYLRCTSEIIIIIIINMQDNLISYSSFSGPSALKLNHCCVNTCITDLQQISPIPGHILSVLSRKKISIWYCPRIRRDVLAIWSPKWCFSQWQSKWSSGWGDWWFSYTTNKTGNIRRTQSWGAFVQPLLRWEKQKVLHFLSVCL
jgi:hypothetical protein